MSALAHVLMVLNDCVYFGAIIPSSKFSRQARLARREMYGNRI